MVRTGRDTTTSLSQSKNASCRSTSNQGRYLGRSAHVCPQTGELIDIFICLLSMDLTFQVSRLMGSSSFRYFPFSCIRSFVGLLQLYWQMTCSAIPDRFIQQPVCMIDTLDWRCTAPLADVVGRSNWLIEVCEFGRNAKTILAVDRESENYCRDTASIPRYEEVIGSDAVDY